MLRMMVAGVSVAQVERRVLSVPDPSKLIVVVRLSNQRLDSQYLL